MTGLVDIDFGVMRRASATLSSAAGDLEDAASRARQADVSTSAFGLMNLPFGSALPPLSELVEALISTGAAACVTLASDVDAARQAFEDVDADSGARYTAAAADLAGQKALQ